MNIQELEYMETRASEVAALLGYLANPGRMRIMCALSAGHLSVGELSTALNMPQPTVSQHLAKLRDAALIRSVRDGTRVINQLDDPKIIELMGVLYRLYCSDKDT